MRSLIIVFVKWPEPGEVKTRLGASVGDREAMRIYRALVREVGLQLKSCRTEAVAICYTPPDKALPLRAWITQEAFPQEVAPAHWWAQPEGDLGQRQASAVRQAFDLGYERVALIGTDCLGIDGSLVREAWRALEGRDWVFGPTEDGGYYLAATQYGKISPEVVFSGVRWSSACTLADCLERLRGAGGSASRLKTLEDVDTYEDWIKVRDRVKLDPPTA